MNTTKEAPISLYITSVTAQAEIFMLGRPKEETVTLSDGAMKPISTSRER